MTEILETIRRHVTERGYPPTIRELAREHGMSIGYIHAKLVELEAQGWIERQPNGPRSIRIIERREDGNRSVD